MSTTRPSAVERSPQSFTPFGLARRSGTRPPPEATPAHDARQAVLQLCGNAMKRCERSVGRTSGVGRCDEPDAMDPVGGARMPDAREVLERLVGRELETVRGRPNVIHEIGPDAVLVATER